MIHALVAGYGPYKKIVFAVMLGSVVTAALEVVFPMLIRQLLQDVLPLQDGYLLAERSFLLFSLYLLCLAVTFGVHYYGRAMGCAIENDLRCRLFAHLEGMPFSFYDNMKVGQLLSRLISDIAEIGELAFQLPNLLVVCTITMLGGAACLVYIHWQMSLVVMVLLLVKTADTIILNGKMKTAFHAARREVGNLGALATESLGAVRLVQAFANEARERRRFACASRRVQDAQTKTVRCEAYLLSSVTFFSHTLHLLIIGIGACLIMGGSLTFADLVAYLLYLMLFIRPIMQLTLLTERYQRGLAGFRRCQELLAAPPLCYGDEKAISAGPIKGDVVFRHVNFSYDGVRPVLTDFNLHIRPGEKVAVVGATGAGKSSIANLLLRFYDFQSGEILLDGVNIRQYELSFLRRTIGIVPQDVFLFSDSIGDNIAFGRSGASFAEIREAAAAAHAADFIEALPDGYESFIGERGVKLSGGQKQRLAIARIFLKNPPVLILDEATSALDNETEKQIVQSLKKVAEQRTTLVIAHRLATVQDADRILVLQNGVIAESGSHQELMARRGVYYELAAAQIDGGKR
ncbi:MULTISPECIES: ABC transporter ATP-binding protein [Megasphaera]|uniref:ABC transporter transmembrane region n=1 Tax=Megasphaera vaginalis (ex Srinivasan et al. 2021) TaxID=1111454 RepID=U7ULF1_9FIRM|nr:MULTISPECIES: ABC transporter ATP-binding protein [Megasphaera]ERT60140.1 ABC transporter transmembrane region [Megasphaera vaginalis (ex Srinivasan et al. 2021)]